MSTVDFNPGRTSKPKEYFATTHWSIVLTAGGHDTARASGALEQLCQTYWYPIYAYVRRRGFSAEDAQDLTQGFFECLLQRKSLAHVDPQRGRFRSFMLGAVNHYLADESEKSRAQKRGGTQEPLSLDWVAAEQRYDLEPADTSTPDKEFEKRWATTLLEIILNRLEKEYRAEGKAGLFTTLKPGLMGTGESVRQAELAKAAGMSEGATRVAIHRLRKRYRELLRAEIANTVLSSEEVEQEMRYLFETMVER